jgi:hypothetical protein
VTHGQRASLETVGRRMGAFVDYLRLMPAMLRTRRHLRKGNLTTDEELLAWMYDASWKAVSSPVPQLADEPDGDGAGPAGGS